jgi:hypothetical protein
MAERLARGALSLRLAEASVSRTPGRHARSSSGAGTSSAPSETPACSKQRWLRPRRVSAAAQIRRSRQGAVGRRRAPRLLCLSGRRALVARPVRRRRQASAQQRRRRLGRGAPPAGTAARRRRSSWAAGRGQGGGASRRTRARDAPRRWSRTTGCGVPDGIVATYRRPPATGHRIVRVARRPRRSSPGRDRPGMGERAGRGRRRT